MELKKCDVWIAPSGLWIRLNSTTLLTRRLVVVANRSKWTWFMGEDLFLSEYLRNGDWRVYSWCVQRCAGNVDAGLQLVECLRQVGIADCVERDKVLMTGDLRKHEVRLRFALRYPFAQHTQLLDRLERAFPSENFGRVRRQLRIPL